MPAKTEKQRKAAGAALAAKRGKMPMSQLRGASRQMAKMPEKKLRHFAMKDSLEDRLDKALGLNEMSPIKKTSGTGRDEVEVEFERDDYNLLNLIVDVEYEWAAPERQTRWQPADPGYFDVTDIKAYDKQSEEQLPPDALNPEEWERLQQEAFEILKNKLKEESEDIY